MVGLTTAIGVIRGTGSEAFAVGLVFSIVVCTPIYPLDDLFALYEYPDRVCGTLSRASPLLLSQQSAPGWSVQTLHLLQEVIRCSTKVCVVQVMYDASGVRLHAGRQASVLNMIITELPPDHPVSDTRPLRDSLGHTPLQVRQPSPLMHSSWSACVPPIIS